MKPWIYVVWYGSVFSPLIPLLFAWKSRTLYQKITVLFISVSFASDLLTTFIIKGRNLHILQAYGLIEALILFWFYSIVLNNSKRRIFFLASGFIIFYALNSFLFEAGQFNTWGRSIQSIIFIILSLRLFYQFFTKEEDIFRESSPLFWINVGLLVYFSGAFFSFILSKVMPITIFYWIFHNSSNILKNVILAVGFSKVKKK